MRLKWSAVVVLALAAGCSNSAVAPVAGRVTLDGQPLAGVVVSFQPVGEDRHNPGMGSIGTTDSEGYYILRQVQPERVGAVVGLHRVTLRLAPNRSSEDRARAAHLTDILKQFDREPNVDVPPSGLPNQDFHFNSPRKP